MRQTFSFGSGRSAPPPRDVVIILAALFVTFSLRFFATTRLIPALLELTPWVWARGWLWQLASYPFVGSSAGGLWFLIELLILFWFLRDVYAYLGRSAFWRLLAWSCLPAAMVAVALDWLMALSGASSPLAFQLMQGQRMLLAVAIAAFACTFRDATIYLFFVLPVQARWFIAIEILLAFMGFLSTKDLAGFAGIVTAVGLAWGMLSGGVLRNLRRLRLRALQLFYRARLAVGRRRRGLRVVRGSGRGGAGGGSDGRGGSGPHRGPWVN